MKRPQQEAKQFFLQTWKELNAAEGKIILIPVAVQKEMIDHIEVQLSELRAEMAQEIIDMKQVAS